LPRLLAWLWRRPAGARRSILWAALPLIVWYAFATIYYGTPLPNTVLAKLETGIPLAALIQQGSYYLLESLMHDPVTLCTIGAACAWAIVRPGVTTISMAAGLILQLLFILRVGGDFMSGRFLSAPFVCATVIVAWQAGAALMSRRAALMAVAGAIATISVVTPKSPWRVWSPLPLVDEMQPDFHGVLDERRFYYRYTGLLAALAGHRPSEHPWAADAAKRRGMPPLVLVADAVGLAGFYGGPGVHLVDEMALTDPLLARLPARPGSRIGHFQRMLPDGYLAGFSNCLQHVFPHAAVMPPEHTCLEWPAETNQLTDPRLAREYDLIRTVTQQPLFSASRLGAVVRLNLGREADER